MPSTNDSQQECVHVYPERILIDSSTIPPSLNCRFATSSRKSARLDWSHHSVIELQHKTMRCTSKLYIMVVTNSIFRYLLPLFDHSVLLNTKCTSLLGEMDDRGSDRYARGAPREASKTAREH
jgi:hypothetical protein